MAVKSMNEERKHPTPTEELCDLVREMLTEMLDYDLIGCCRYVERARELGIEVEDE